MTISCVIGGSALLLPGLIGLVRADAGPRWVAACVVCGIGSGLLGWALS